MNVLVVDDHPAFLAAVKNMLAVLGVSAATATSAAEGVDSLRSQHWDVVLLDLHMPDHDGLWVLEHAPLPRQTRVIPVSGYIPPEVGRRLERLGTEPPLLKPFGLTELAGAMYRSGPVSP